jgi:hypothetical protein
MNVMEGKISGDEVKVNMKAATAVFRKNRYYGKVKDIPAQDSFYFRLTGTNLYYTETKTDMIVLGAIAIKNVFSTSES